MLRGRDGSLHLRLLGWGGLGGRAQGEDGGTRGRRWSSLGLLQQPEEHESATLCIHVNAESWQLVCGLRTHHSAAACRLNGCEDCAMAT